MSLKSPPEDSWPFLYLLQFDLFCSHCALKVCCPLFPFMEFSSRYVMPSCLDFKSSINFILCLWITFQSPKIMSCKKVIERKMSRLTKVDSWAAPSILVSLQYTLMQRLFLDLSFLSIAFMIHCLSNDAASKTPTLTSIIAAWREAS